MSVYSCIARRMGCLGLCLLVLAACAPADPTAGAAAEAQAAEVEAAASALAATLAQDRIATSVAATLTAQPTTTATDTPVPTDTHTATPAPTDTPAPTRTPRPTTTAVPSDTATPRPTLPPVSPTPAAPASIYGWASGPAEYVTDIECTYSGGECTAVMPPGDISFEFVLISFLDSPLTLFEQYGLSVERDGGNVADMFMFVDAGLLPPDTGVWFGASRRFSAPGRYVVRSSGCLTTVPAPCGWHTMEGTTVTFVIQ